MVVSSRVFSLVAHVIIITATGASERRTHCDGRTDESCPVIDDY